MSDSASMSLLRSVAAVVLGMLAATVTVMVLTWLAVLLMLGGDMTAAPTTPYLAVNLAYSFGAAALGGWVTARIAARRPVLHAAILAALMLVLTGFGDGSPEPGVPAWYAPAIGALGAVGALAGGLLRRHGVRSKAPATPRSPGG